MAQLVIQGLSFSYQGSLDKKVLDGIQMEIGQGEFIALCGKSGSGKSTLLRNLKTALTPHGVREGNIYLDGVPLEEVSFRDQSSRIGYVMQNPESQIVTDKVWHELAFGLESLGFGTQTIRRRVGEMANYFGIQGWFHKNVRELSGGQKQLLNLASVMVMQPDILILDEPVSQLDPIAASGFLTAVRKINQEFGTSILLSEHQMEEVVPYADKTAVLEGGKLLVYDTPRNAAMYLKEHNHVMFQALPAVMQIFYETGAAGTCPLTVREGRVWLSKHVKGIKQEKSLSVLEHKSDKNQNKKDAVVLKDIYFRYEPISTPLLNGISLKIEENTIFAIVGGNGTGKTTLLKIIAGLERPERGKVLIAGQKSKFNQNRNQNQNQNRTIAMVPQEPLTLFTKKTVKEELLDICKDDEELRRICQLTNLEELLFKHPYDLSGGEQQRAALAIVLLLHPKILLLDEPTKGLDIGYKHKLAAILENLARDGVTIIMVSHDIEFCAAYADRAAMLFDGSVLASDEAGNFFGDNYFYTTSVNRLVHGFAHGLVDGTMTKEQVISWCSQIENEKEERHDL